MFFQSKLPSGNMMQEWQYDLLRRMGQKTVVLGPRRLGKTFALAYIARRKMMQQKFNFQNMYRPVNVIYIWLTDEKNQSVVQYLKWMEKSFKDSANQMFYYNPATGVYEFRQGSGKNMEVLWQITLTTIKSFEPWVGNFWDMIVIDEFVKVPRSVYEWLEPIIDNEWADFLAASTLYYDAPKNRWYDLLVEYEQQSMDKQDIYKYIEERRLKFHPLAVTEQPRDESTQESYMSMMEEFKESNEYVGIRYTIDDIEYMNDAKKDKIKEKYWRMNKERYYSELYARYADEWKVFNYQHSVAQPELIAQSQFEYAVVANDPAKDRDESAVLVSWRDKNKRKIFFVEEQSIKKMWEYKDQAIELLSIMKRAEKYVETVYTSDWKERPKNYNVYMAVDGTQKATVEVMEIRWLEISLKIVYWWWESFSKKTYNEYVVSKKYLVDVARECFENWMVLVSKELKQLFKEFDNFYKKVGKDGASVTYEWVWSTDDFVNAFCISCFFYHEVMWIKWIIGEKTPLKLPDSKPVSHEAELLKSKKEYDKETQQKKLDKIRVKNNNIYFQQFVY